MKWVELRRHAERAKPSERLTPAGKAAAAALGRSADRFDLVVSSTSRRAAETAAAMGFPIGRTDPVWTSLWDGFDEQYPLLRTFGDFQAAFKSEPNAKLFGTRLVGTVRRLAEALPDGGRVLVLTHGGMPELVVAAARPDDTAFSAEPVLERLEGVAFEFEDDRVVKIRILRKP